jgi:outer membrane protein TolC
MPEVTRARSKGGIGIDASHERAAARRPARRAAALIVAAALVLGPALGAAGQQPPPSAPVPPGTPAAPPGQAPAAPPPAPPPTIPPVPAVPQTPARPLSLADAIAIALQNNYSIRQAALQVAVLRSQLQQAEAQLAVTLGGNAGFTYNTLSTSGAPLIGTISIPGAGIVNQQFVTGPGITGTGTPATSWTFGLTFKYPLYTGNALEDQIAIAQANLAAQQASFATTVEQTAFTVSQAFYQVQAAQANVDAAQRAVDAAQENVRVTAAQVRVGTSPQFNLLQAQVQLATSQQMLTSARTTLSQAYQTLAQNLVLPLSTTFGRVATPPLPQVPQDVAALVAQAMQNRPEIAQAVAAERAATAAIDLAAAGLRPNVTVSAGPQIQTADIGKFPVNVFAAIAFTIAILDGGLTKAKIEQARTQLQAAQVTEQQVRQQVELDVRNAYLALGNAAESLRSALAGQAAAREALRIANVRFQAGVGTQLDVVTAIQNLATADTNVVQATLNYFVGVAQLDRAVGIQVRI